MNPQSEVISRLERIERLVEGTARLPMNLDEAAAYLKLSKSYLYKLTSQSRIPHYKPEGKKVYFEKSELDQWLTRNRVATKEEIQNEAILKMKDKRRTRG